MPKDDKTAEEVFRRINSDARQAYCLGDLDLEDVIDTELEPLDRRRVRKMLRQWGHRRGIENAHGKDED